MYRIRKLTWHYLRAFLVDFTPESTNQSLNQYLMVLNSGPVYILFIFRLFFPTHLNLIQMGRLFKEVLSNLLAPRGFYSPCISSYHYKVLKV